MHFTALRCTQSQYRPGHSLNTLKNFTLSQELLFKKFQNQFKTNYLLDLHTSRTHQPPVLLNICLIQELTDFFIIIIIIILLYKFSDKLFY